MHPNSLTNYWDYGPSSSMNKLPFEAKHVNNIIYIYPMISCKTLDGNWWHLLLANSREVLPHVFSLNTVKLSRMEISYFVQKDFADIFVVR
jgi:hypothetical protein